MHSHASFVEAARAACILVLVLSLGAAGCDLPRDANGTLDRVRDGTMRVGVISDPPWANDSGSVVGGVEGAMVGDLASRLNARVEWVRRPEAELLLALKRRELDMVIGGLTASLPWRKEVAFTRAYYTDTVAIGAPPGMRVPSDLKGQTVAVTNGSAVAAELRAKGAAPLPMQDISRATGLVAAPTWELAGMGRSITDITLEQNPHVLAAPQGENAWLVQIEQMLRRRRSAVPIILRAAHK